MAEPLSATDERGTPPTVGGVGLLGGDAALDCVSAVAETTLLERIGALTRS